MFSSLSANLKNLVTEILHLHCTAHQGLKPLANNQSPLKRTGNGFQSSLEDLNY